MPLSPSPCSLFPPSRIRLHARRPSPPLRLESAAGQCPSPPLRPSVRPSVPPAFIRRGLVPAAPAGPQSQRQFPFPVHHLPSSPFRRSPGPVRGAPVPPRPCPAAGYAVSCTSRSGPSFRVRPSHRPLCPTVTGHGPSGRDRDRSRPSGSTWTLKLKGIEKVRPAHRQPPPRRCGICARRPPARLGRQALAGLGADGRPLAASAAVICDGPKP